MLSYELRQKYIDFFVGKDHLHLPGAPVVPVDALGVEDKSTLFTSAGMQQFKPYFTGEAAPPARRIATVQKCVRTGDIESVGDYSHCTFFEMLGNFSFGDYFKKEVIAWTWEFLTGWLKLDPDRMCVTVFEDDDEAFAVWRDDIGLPTDRIHRLGQDKNYWPANAISDGPNGPCGPCTEVFYRVVPQEEMSADPDLTPTQRYKVDDDAGRWLEIWNNVFTQFNRSEDPDGQPILQPLPNKNNDTGAGFERLVCLMQGVTSVFDTDLFRPALQRISELAGKPYGGTMSPVDTTFRVVAEHTRTAVFCIADGILPSNEGRGYVLRRVMRRAIRLGRSVLGFDAPFMHEVAPEIIRAMGSHFTEIVDRRDHILRTLLAEEERFRRTLDNGEQRLSDLLSTDAVRSSGRLSGADAFTLYDTFGFPLQLTEEIAAERGITVDGPGFAAAMEEQRERSREATGIDKDVFKSIGSALAEIQRTTSPTEFVGYHADVVDGAVVQAIIRNGELVDFARAGDTVEIVLSKTPFYAESGGQVGDAGAITSAGARFGVADTRKAAGIFLHAGTVASGEIGTGETVQAAVDGERRAHVMRNHTATHLLHAALRSVLGTHVHQKGSLVAADRLRFDFTHTQPMTPDQVRQVEDIVNAEVLADRALSVTEDVPIAEARSRGAMALFGEKYGDAVRVVEVPGVSIELCGGTHLKRTSQTGLFKIMSETGIAAGVRRIEALTGQTAWGWVKEREDLFDRIAAVLKTSPRDVLVAAEKLVAARSQLEKQVQQLRSGAAAGSTDFAETEIAGVRLVTCTAASADGDDISAIVDRLAKSHPDAIVVVGGAGDGKVAFAAKVAPDLVKRGFHAGNLLREVAKAAGGGGGGRPDFAQAGGRDPSKLGEALARAAEIVEGQARGARQ